MAGLINTTSMNLKDLIAPVGANSPPANTVVGATPIAATPQNVASTVAPTTLNPQARDITKNETVAGQMSNLLDQNGEYMQSARNTANAQSNSRGLLNSSLAVGASQKAAIDSAMPIATEDAQTYANSGMSAQQSRENLGLTGYKSLLDSAQQKENFGYNSALSKQENEQNTALNTQNIEANKALAAQNQEATSKLSAQQAKQQSAQSTQEAEQTLKLQTYLNDTPSVASINTLNAQSKQVLLATLEPMFTNMQKEISAITQLPDTTMSPEVKAAEIGKLQAQAKATANTMASLIGYPLTWS